MDRHDVTSRDRHIAPARVDLDNPSGHVPGFDDGTRHRHRRP
ncbi:hypothetical protein [Actinomadura viridis]|uniref:Uncharacterized protein n=1 Tax=Actinomadura viridis TaxID=58110 RepID=A0A931DQA9_9ACTN|nr:hypothetical protein [Actinomadura viridis]MBG6090758.1 hypothetical protein [Actinomadura viridis]